MLKAAFPVIALLCVAVTAAATPIEFSGASADRAAWASFAVEGNNLVVTLANTSASDVLIPESVLTAIFFTSDISLSLQPISAVVPAGSSVLFGGTDPGGSVGGEWGYAAGLTRAPGGRSYGISSAGLGLFGPSDVFPGSNLQGPASLNGLEYGVVSTGDDPLTGNAAVTGKSALIKDRVVFTFAGIPAEFEPGLHIRDVFFQYGTSLAEGGMGGTTPIPEPLMLGLFSVGGVFFMRRRSGS